VVFRSPNPAIVDAVQSHRDNFDLQSVFYGVIPIQQPIHGIERSGMEVAFPAV
jgi:hypothetical protein